MKGFFQKKKRERANCSSFIACGELSKAIMTKFTEINLIAEINFSNIKVMRTTHIMWKHTFIGCTLEERKNEIFLKNCFGNNETFSSVQNCKTNKTSITREILSNERAVADALETFCLKIPFEIP